MRRFFVAGNWKMYGTFAEVTILLQGIKMNLQNFNSADVVVFPSFVYLQYIRDLLKNSSIYFGAQNLNEHEQGAFTGEVSGKMLKDLGCQYVIIGHSERRQYYRETNEWVAKKVAAALICGLTPVICIGETKEERESQQTEKMVLTQLQTVIHEIGIEALAKTVIAYEPVWAIGTGLTATPEQAEDVHGFIRQVIEKSDKEVAKGIRIIYGGSVKPDNAEAIFSQPNVDGGLIGGASLKVDSFVEICHSVKR